MAKAKKKPRPAIQYAEPSCNLAQSLLMQGLCQPDAHQVMIQLIVSA